MNERESEERLISLANFKGYRVAKGESDIRGWEVVSADKKKIGKIHELIVDTVDMKVRYLDVDVDNKVLETKTNSHILIPIAGAQLDDDDNRVYLNDISITELTALPPYDHRRITRDFETNIASWFRKASAPATDTPQPLVQATADDARFYEGEQFSDSRFWGRRRAGREKQRYLVNEASDEDKVV